MKTLLVILSLSISTISFATATIELEVDGKRADITDSLITLNNQDELRIPLQSAESVILHINPEPKTHWDFLKMVRVLHGQTVLKDLQQGIQSKPFDIELVTPMHPPATSGQALVLLTERFKNTAQNQTEQSEKTVLIRIVLGQNQGQTQEEK